MSIIGDVDAMIAEAVRRIVTKDFGESMTPDILEAYIEDEIHGVTVQSWGQAFGSTAGPWGGIGGQAMTGFRVTAILVGHTMACYVGGRHFRDYDVRTDAGWKCFNERQLP